MKYNIAESSFREIKDQETIAYSNGCFRTIEELQKILIEHKRPTTYDNKIIGEKSLVK